MNKNRGMTLIELMIAMLLGIIIVSGTIAMYISTLRGSTDTLNSARLNYDLDSVMQLMVNDIRRAGYWGGAIVNSVATDNPFTDGAANILISDYTDTDGTTYADGCILYSYDVDDGDDSTTPDTPDGNVNEDEYYGFRIDRSAVWMRLSVDVSGGEDPSDCGDGEWTRIIDENKLSIEGLTFSDTNYKCLNVRQGEAYGLSCAAVIAADVTDLVTDETAVEARQIDITLQGEVKSDDAVTKSLTGIVKVRNDRIFIQ